MCVNINLFDYFLVDRYNTHTMPNRKKSLKGRGQYLKYKQEGRLEFNKKRKLARHLKRHPGDTTATKSLMGSTTG